MKAEVLAAEAAAYLLKKHGPTVETWAVAQVKRLGPLIVRAILTSRPTIRRRRIPGHMVGQRGMVRR